MTRFSSTRLHHMGISILALSLALSQEVLATAYTAQIDGTLDNSGTIPLSLSGDDTLSVPTSTTLTSDQAATVTVGAGQTAKSISVGGGSILNTDTNGIAIEIPTGTALTNPSGYGLEAKNNSTLKNISVKGTLSSASTQAVHFDGATVEDVIVDGGTVEGGGGNGISLHGATTVNSIWIKGGEVKSSASSYPINLDSSGSSTISNGIILEGASKITTDSSYGIVNHKTINGGIQISGTPTISGTDAFIWNNGKNSDGLTINLDDKSTPLSVPSTLYHMTSTSTASGNITFNKGTINAPGGFSLFLRESTSAEGTADNPVAYTFEADSTFSFNNDNSTLLKISGSNNFYVTINQAGTVAAASGKTATGYDVTNDKAVVTLNLSGTLNTGSATAKAIAANGSAFALTTSGAGALTGNINLGANAASSITHGSSAPINGNITLGNAAQKLTIAGTGGITGTIDGGQLIVNQDKSFTTGGTIGATTPTSLDIQGAFTMGHDVTTSGTTLGRDGALTVNTNKTLTSDSETATVSVGAGQTAKSISVDSGSILNTGTHGIAIEIPTGTALMNNTNALPIKTNAATINKILVQGTLSNPNDNTTYFNNSTIGDFTVNGGTVSAGKYAISFDYTSTVNSIQILNNGTLSFGNSESGIYVGNNTTVTNGVTLGSGVQFTAGGTGIFCDYNSSLGGLTVDTGTTSTLMTVPSEKTFYSLENGTGGGITFTSGKIVASDNAAAVFYNGLSTGEGSADAPISYTFDKNSEFSMGSNTKFLSLAGGTNPFYVTINHKGNVHPTSTNTFTGYDIANDKAVVILNLSGVLNTGTSSSGTYGTALSTNAAKVTLTTSGAGALTGNINLGANADSSITHGSSNPINGNITLGNAAQKLIIDGTGGITGTIDGGQLIVNQGKSFTTGETIGATTPTILAVNGSFTMNHDIKTPGLVMGSKGQFIYNKGDLTCPIDGGTFHVAEGKSFSTKAAIGKNIPTALTVDGSLTMNHDITTSGLLMGAKGQFLYKEGTFLGSIDGGQLIFSGIGNKTWSQPVGQKAPLLQLSINNSSLTFSGGVSATGDSNLDAFSITNNSQLILTPTNTLKGGGTGQRGGMTLVDSTLINRGSMSLNSTGTALNVQGRSFVFNDGLMTLSGATGLALGGGDFKNAGTVDVRASGSGITLASGVVLENSGLITLHQGGLNSSEGGGSALYRAIITGAGAGKIVAEQGAGQVDLSNITLKISNIATDLEGRKKITPVKEGAVYTLLSTAGGDRITLPKSWSADKDGNYNLTQGTFVYQLKKQTIEGTTTLTAQLKPLEETVPQDDQAAKLVATLLLGQKTAQTTAPRDFSILEEFLVEKGSKGFESSLSSGSVVTALAQPAASVNVGEIMGSTGTAAEGTQAFLNFEGKGRAVAAGTFFEQGAEGLHLWFKTTATRSSQNPIGTYAGNTAHGYGWTGAITSHLADGNKVGVALNYLVSRTHEAFDGVSNTKAANMGLTIYGLLSPFENWFIEGAATLGKTAYKTFRQDAWKKGYDGDFDGALANLEGKIGRIFKFASGIDFSPFIAFQAGVTKTQGYIESGPDDWNLKFPQGMTVKSLQAGGGAKVSHKWQLNDEWRMIPYASLSFMHEFNNQSRSVNAQWLGETITLQTPQFGRQVANIGLGTQAKSKNGIDLSLDYNAALKNKFVAHTGSLRVSYKLKPAAERREEGKIIP